MFLDQKLADSPSRSVIREYVGFSCTNSNLGSANLSGGIKLSTGFYQTSAN